MANKQRDSQGRFISPAAELAEKARDLVSQAAELEAEAGKLVEAEAVPPPWLRKLIIAVADSFGITPEEFSARIRVVHPTPSDPVLVVDGKAVVSWI